MTTTTLPPADTLQSVEAPPLAPLSDEQTRFLRLHARKVVTKSWWLMQGMWLRARTDDGDVVTLSFAGFRALVDGGYVEAIGSAGVRLTDKGKAAV